MPHFSFQVLYTFRWPGVRFYLFYMESQRKSFKDFNFLSHTSYGASSEYRDHDLTLTRGLLCHWAMEAYGGESGPWFHTSRLRNYYTTHLYHLARWRRRQDLNLHTPKRSERISNPRQYHYAYVCIEGSFMWCLALSSPAISLYGYLGFTWLFDQRFLRHRLRLTLATLAPCERLERSWACTPHGFQGQGLTIRLTRHI